jgi:hypothetical protein
MHIDNNTSPGARLIAFNRHGGVNQMFEFQYHGAAPAYPGAVPAYPAGPGYPVGPAYPGPAYPAVSVVPPAYHGGGGLVIDCNC